MATETPETSGARGNERSEDAGLRSRAKRAASAARRRGRNGRAALSAGGLLLARAARTVRRNRRRAVAYGLAGAALIGLGIRQRRSASDPQGESSASGTEGSAEATAHLEQSDVLHQSEMNPRGTSGEPDVETKTDPDEGSIRFTEEGEEARSEPHLEEEGAHDPRLEDDEDAVEIDLSEASMADEASEAVGPTPEQAQPASTEETEPEPTPAEDESHVDADVPDESDDEDAAEAAGSDDEEDEEE